MFNYKEKIDSIPHNSIVKHGKNEYILKKKYDEKYKIGIQSGNYTSLTNTKTKKETVLNGTNKDLVLMLTVL